MKNISQIHSNVLNAKNLAIMGVYTMDILYVVNVESENQTIPPSTTISTTDVPTAVKTIHPISDHAQSGKRKRNFNHKTRKKHSLSRNPENS